MGKLSSVLVFSTLHLPTGGIESHLQEFCLQMTKAGVTVDLIILNSEMLPETEAFFKKICRKVYLGNYGYSSRRLSWLMGLGIKLRTKRYDAIYTNGQGSSILLFSMLTRAKTWVHHHHTSGDESDRATWTRSYRKALNKADNVIACSTRNAFDLEQSLQRDIMVIPCFSRQVSSIETEYTKSQKLKFGYYGRLIPEKGIDLICKMSEDKDFADIEFNLWGEGTAYPPDFFSSFPKLQYHGAFFGFEGLIKVISSLDASLLISTHPEGLPISLLEAMSAGLPWLATDKGGIPDIACDPISTRVIPAASDYNQVKTAVLSLAHDLKAGLISKRKQTDIYNQKFSAKVIVTQWKQVLGLANNPLRAIK